MATAKSILNELKSHGATVTARGENLEVRFKENPGSEVEALLPELRRHKPEVLALLKSVSTRTIDGHPVKRIVWETEKAIVFQDDQGRFWRYLHEFKTAWPVVIVNRTKESA